MTIIMAMEAITITTIIASRSSFRTTEVNAVLGTLALAGGELKES